MPIVSMPDGARVNFPDDMPKEQIAGLIASKYPDAVPKTTGEYLGDAANGLGEGLQMGFSKLGTGIIQTAADAAGLDKISKLSRISAAKLENQSAANKQKNPVTGTIGEIAPQMLAISGFGVGLPAIAGGSALLGYTSPEADESLVKPDKGTALTRLLQPVNEGSSKIAEMAGLDPNSRAGRAMQGAIMGAGTYGVGKAAVGTGRAINNGSRSAIRGLTKIDQDAVDALQKSGIDPTLQLASDSFATRSLANSIGKLPLVGNRLSDSAEGAISKLSGNVDDMAANLGPASDQIEGGAALQRGIDRFRTQTGDMAKRNYETVDNLIPPESPANMANTRDFSQNYLNKYSSTPNIGSSIQESHLSGLSKGILKDTKPKVTMEKQPKGGVIDYATGAKIAPKNTIEYPEVPYGTLKNLRSDIGEQAGKMDAPGAYKQMYGAASEDMLATARGVSPEAAQAAARANNYYRAVTQRSEKLKRFFTQHQDGTFRMSPEQAAHATRQDLQLLKKSIPKEDFDNYAASVLRKMGEAPAGAQNATGEVFSPNTFLTNYNKLMKSGKADVIFDKNLSQELNRTAKVADRFRQLGKAANTSNTTNAALITGSLAGLYLAPTTTAALGGGAYGMSRLLTSPKALKVINDYAYRPVTKGGKAGAEFSQRLLQATEADAQLNHEARQYLDILNDPRVKLYNKRGEEQ